MANALNDTRGISYGSPYDRRNLADVYQGMKDAYINGIQAVPEWLVGKMAPEQYNRGVIASTPKDRIRASQMHREQNIAQRRQDIGRDYEQGMDYGTALGFIADPYIDGPLAGIAKLGKVGQATRAQAKPFNALSDLARDETGAVGDIAYHGTSRDVQKFDPAKFGESTQAKSAKQGIWVVSDPNTAHGYADYSARNAPIEAKIREANAHEKRGDWDAYDDALREAEELEAKFSGKTDRLGQNIMPLKYEGDYHTVDMDGAEFMQVQDDINKTISKAKRDGKDGVIFQNLSDDAGFSGRPAEHTVVFDPKNVKSAFEGNKVNALAGERGAIDLPSGEDFLYHGTGEGAFRNIRASGLKPQVEGKHVYFSTDPQYASTYAKRKGAPHGERVLRVKKTNAITEDPDTGYVGDFKSLDAIPPEMIEVKVNGKWMNIQEYKDEAINIL